MRTPLFVGLLAVAAPGVLSAQTGLVGLPGSATAFLAGDSDIIASDTVYVRGYHPLYDLARKTTSGVIGVDPIPAGGAGALVARLQMQADSACTRGWITSCPLCSTLHAEAGSDTYSSVNHFGSSLDSARSAGSAVSDAAYWLLKPNASYALSHITPPPLNKVSGP